MKISLITITYNSGKTLRDTMHSVLAQTYKNIDYIVVDGDSTDDTLEIIKEYEPKFEGRMRYISEHDNGIYDAMNKGIKMAQGKVVGILNSDDVFFNNDVLMRIVQSFEENDIDCLFANLVFVDSSDTNKIVRRWKGSPYVSKKFFTGWSPAHPTFYVKRAMYEKYGLYDTSLDVSADFELMLRFIAKYKIKTLFLDHYFVRMRYGGESTGSVLRIMKGNKNIIKAFKINGLHVPRTYLIRRLAPKVWNIVRSKIPID